MLARGKARLTEVRTGLAGARLAGMRARLAGMRVGRTLFFTPAGGGARGRREIGQKERERE